MNVLDENVPRDQADLLQQWGIRCRSISRDLGYGGMGDDNIVPMLLRLKKPTLLTRDRDFFARELLHPGYSLVWFDVGAGETAFYIRRFLKHSSFKTNALRLGKVIQVRASGIEYWARSFCEVILIDWE